MIAGYANEWALRLTGGGTYISTVCRHVLFPYGVYRQFTLGIGHDTRRLLRGKTFNSARHQPKLHIASGAESGTARINICLANGLNGDAR